MEQINEFESSSQAGQDKFAWIVTGRKTDGVFLDIGCNHPTKHSNSYSLENQGWRGLLVDIQAIPALATRLSDFIVADATCADWPSILQTCLPNKHIDYLSLDCDEATTTVLRKLLALGPIFSILTIEHDAYRLGTANRDTQRSLLRAEGYELICSDVCIGPGPGVPGEGGPFEDWWVYPTTVEMGRAEPLRCDGKLHSQIFHA